MIKLLSIAISAMVVLLVSLFSEPESKISLTATVPDHLVPGDDCLVKIKLNRGDASGYAQLQQVIPPGLKAKAVETMGARFELQDNIANFIWTSLPEENSFTVSYIIQTDPNESASASLPGAFVYSENNQALTVEMEPVLLSFSPPPASAVEEGGVDRKIIAVTPESGEYRVELTIHKKVGENTARFVDNIPDGYTVTNINAGNSRFMFSNRQATFLWSPLPQETTFSISYTLDAAGTQAGNPVVTGVLVYGGEGETQTSIASATASVTTGSTTASGITNPSEVIAANLVARENERLASNPVVQTVAASSTKITPQMASAPTTYIAAPEKGIFYKIQIAATRKSPIRNDKYFESKYHLGQHVDLTEHEGWRKYMIGHFDSFNSANEFNTRMRDKIPDAFVVAYRNAERISITDAVNESKRSD